MSFRKGFRHRDLFQIVCRAGCGWYDRLRVNTESDQGRLKCANCPYCVFLGLEHEAEHRYHAHGGDCFTHPRTCTIRARHVFLRTAGAAQLPAWTPGSCLLEYVPATVEALQAQVRRQ